MISTVSWNHDCLSSSPLECTHKFLFVNTDPGAQVFDFSDDWGYVIKIFCIISTKKPCEYLFNFYTFVISSGLVSSFRPTDSLYLTPIYKTVNICTSIFSDSTLSVLKFITSSKYHLQYDHNHILQSNI